jgi:ribulose-5-phosphate 4-epimerase/fuculose-1-phosphate aldolase
MPPLYHLSRVAQEEHSRMIAPAATEEHARAQLAQCGRALHRLDLFGLAGHVSLRVPESPLILITPGGGLDKARLSAADLVLIDADGKRVVGEHPVPWETPIHTAIHAARPALAAVGHLHAHWSTVFSVVDRPLDVVLNYAVPLRGPVPRYEDPWWVTTPQQAAALVAALGDAPAVLMRGHGITVVGETLAALFYAAMALEENARVLWEASALGAPRPIPADQLPAMADTLETVRADERALQYFANLEASEGEQQAHFGAAS